MACKFNLSSPISLQQLEGELRFNFPHNTIKRNLWGHLSLRDSTDVSVVFDVKTEKAFIYAHTPFWIGLFTSGNMYATGQMQDEKNEAERRYTDWFKNLFAAHIS